MKKLLLIIPSLLLFGACNYLDIVPDDTPTLDHAFADAITSERYLLTCYSGLPFESNPVYNPAFLGSDEFWFPALDSRWKAEFGSYVTVANLLFGLQNTNSPYVNSYEGVNNATAIYHSIRRCNIFLNKIDGVHNLSALNRNRWVAEAKMIKAYCHFYLMRMYGPIPIIDDEVDIDSAPEDVRFARNTFEECVSYITGLVDEIAPILPLEITRRREELGRFTRPAAMMLKAKVLVLAASPLFNGNDYFHDFKNKDGRPLFGTPENPNPKDPTKWNAAVEACWEAMKVCDEAGIILYDYQDGGTLNEAGRMENTIRRAVTSDDWSPELIMGGGVNVATSLQRSTMARLKVVGTATVYEGALPSTMSVNLNFTRKYYSDKGIPTEEDPDWQERKEFELREPQGAELDYITDMNPQINFNREPRFYASLGFSRGTWYGNEPAEGTDHHILQSYLGETANARGSNVYWSTTAIWPKKMNNMKTADVSGGTYVETYAFPVMRLADLYLLYSECVNEAFGPDGGAGEDGEFHDPKKYLDMVRERAGLKGVDESWMQSLDKDKPSRKEGLREIIHRERTIELAFEGQRFWDVRRWMKFDQEVNRPISGWNIEGANAEDHFQEIVHYKPSLYLRDYLWPIRLELLSVNTNLVQSKGW